MERLNLEMMMSTGMPMMADKVDNSKGMSHSSGGKKAIVRQAEREAITQKVLKELEKQKQK